MNAAANERIQKIAAHVQKKCTAALQRTDEFSAAYTYRWQHTLRVAQYGLQLAREEGAEQETCVAAGLLHDLAKFETKDYGIEHGRVGARMARPLLQTLGYPAKQIENICFSIAVHVDDRADFEHPVTLESKVVNDADNIDRFSAYRFLANNDRLAQSYANLIKSVEKRLVILQDHRLNSIMATASGKRLFNAQIDAQITLMKQLIAESKITCLPEL